MVNAALQMLDAYTGDSLIIATTNHEHLLDSAIWRQFEEVLVFEPSNLEQLKKLLAAKLRGVRREFDCNDRTVVDLFKGQSYADVERVLRRAIKEMILQGQEFLRVHQSGERPAARGCPAESTAEAFSLTTPDRPTHPRPPCSSRLFWNTLPEHLPAPRPCSP